MHLLALDMFVFAIDTLAYDELQHKYQWQHARNTRVGARSASQYVGPGDETISLSGTIYAEISGDYVSLDDLKALAAAGDAYQLVTGAGELLGAFVIERLDERHISLLPDGTPRAIDFALELTRVDDDAGNTDTDE